MWLWILRGESWCSTQERTIWMSWIKRIGLWSVSVLTADFLVISPLSVILALFSWGSAPRAPHGLELLQSVGDSFVSLQSSSLWLVVRGWLLVMPLILIFSRVDGWRFWTLGALATLLGPPIEIAWEGGPLRRGNFFIVWLAVSSLSVVSYLIALRRFSRGTIEATT